MAKASGSKITVAMQVLISTIALQAKAHNLIWLPMVIT